MEISMKKRKSFKYIDFLEFQVVGQTFAVSPTETHYSANEVAFVADEITIKNEPVLLTAELMLGAQLIGAQLCDDSNCEIYLQGDEIFECLDPVFQIEYGFVHFRKDYFVKNTVCVTSDGEPVFLCPTGGAVSVNGVELSRDTAKYLVKYIGEADAGALKVLARELERRELKSFNDGELRSGIIDLLASFLYCPSTYQTEQDGCYEREFLEKRCADLIDDIVDDVTETLLDRGITADQINGIDIDDADLWGFIDSYVENSDFRDELAGLQPAFVEYMETGEPFE